MAIRIYSAVVNTADNVQNIVCVEIAENGIIAEITAPLDYFFEWFELYNPMYRTMYNETYDSGYTAEYWDYDADMEKIGEGYILEFVDYLTQKLK